jgi:hypothetical protein
MGPGRNRLWQKGGSVRFAPRPSTRLGASHTSQSPHTCNGSRTGSNGTTAEGSSRTKPGNRESERGTAWSRAALRELERSLFCLGHEFGEIKFERRRPSDQDHVISYSHAAEWRITGEQLEPGQFAQAPFGPIAINRAFDRPADGDADAAHVALAGHCKGDHASATVKPLAADRCLEIGLPAQPEALLHRA